MNSPTAPETWVSNTLYIQKKTLNHVCILLTIPGTTITWDYNKDFNIMKKWTRKNLITKNKRTPGKTEGVLSFNEKWNNSS